MRVVHVCKLNTYGNLVVVVMVGIPVTSRSLLLATSNRSRRKGNSYISSTPKQKKTMARHCHALMLLTTAVVCDHALPPPPPYTEKASTARYMVHFAEYGVLATTSVHLNGRAFGNIVSLADGTLLPDNSTGVPYFFVSPLDTSMHDVAANNAVSLTLSEQQLSGFCANASLDAEDPRCARLTLSGTMVPVADAIEAGHAQAALFSRHPAMEGWSGDPSHQVNSAPPAPPAVWHKPSLTPAHTSAARQVRILEASDRRHLAHRLLRRRGEHHHGRLLRRFAQRCARLRRRPPARSHASVSAQHSIVMSDDMMHLYVIVMPLKPLKEITKRDRSIIRA